MLFSAPTTSPAETQVADLRDYPEWHRGRERYGLWMLPVEDETVLAYIAQLRARLADLLHPCPRRQPHVTLFVCGFHAAARMHDDDFAPEALSRQLALLSAHDGVPTRLPLGRPDSFASAAFIPLGDPLTRLATWRAVLSLAASEIRQADYVPHITLGLYRRRVSAQVLRARLQSLPAPELSLPVTGLHYATYDARDPFGPLQTHHRVPLRTPETEPA